MKIKKIENMLDIEEQFDVELQACHADCIEYMGKASGDYIKARQAGLKADGSDSISDIRAFKNAYGYYCYAWNTPKNTIYF